MSCNDSSISIVGDLSTSDSVIVHGGCHHTSDGSSPNDQVLRKSKHLAEFITQVDKALARKNLGIPDEFTLRWGNIEGNLEEQKDLYLKLTQLESNIEDLELQLGFNLKQAISEIKDALDTKISKELEGDQATTQIEYNNLEYPNIENIKDALDQALYKELIINSSCFPSAGEEGQIIQSIDYQWDFNKNLIVSQTFDGVQIDSSIRNYTISGNFSQTTTKTLVVDDGIKITSKSITLPFYPGLYYGSFGEGALTTQDIINFEYKLVPSRHTSVTVNADQYIYICIPYSYGEASFKVGGFEGGFQLIDDQFIFNKYKGIQYRIYRSDNEGLGNTTVTII